MKRIWKIFIMSIGEKVWIFIPTFKIWSNSFVESIVIFNCFIMTIGKKDCFLWSIIIRFIEIWKIVINIYFPNQKAKMLLIKTLKTMIARQFQVIRNIKNSKINLCIRILLLKNFQNKVIKPRKMNQQNF